MRAMQKKALAFSVQFAIFAKAFMHFLWLQIKELQKITKSWKNPYITAVLKEMGFVFRVIGRNALSISEIHFGGGTSYFFHPDSFEEN